MDSLYVGIDVAKASFVAAAQGPAGESLWGEFANTPAGFEEWRVRVCAAVDEQLTPGVVVVLEPCAGYLPHPEAPVPSPHWVRGSALGHPGISVMETVQHRHRHELAA